MDIIQVVAIGLITTILSITIKKQNAEIGIIISIAASVLIFMILLPKLTIVVEILKTVAESINTDTMYISTILKIVGISYIAEFGAQICQDAGESAIASKIDLAGKVLIMVVSAPVILALINLIFSILP